MKQNGVKGWCFASTTEALSHAEIPMSTARRFFLPFGFFSSHLRSGRRRKQRKNYVSLMMFFNRKNSKFIHYLNIWAIKAGFKDKK